MPRLRDRAQRIEVPLTTYAQLPTPRAQDVGLFRRVLGGPSCPEYEATAEAVPAAFGLAKSRVSRRSIRTSATALRQLQERRHDDRPWLVLLLDGKHFASDQMVIALGVTTTGEKRILGMVQTAKEDTCVCAAFLQDLVARGSRAPQELLVVVDGAKGLRAAVQEVSGAAVPIQRCTSHRRENVVSYLIKPQQVLCRRKLQPAYAHPSYANAKRALQQPGRAIGRRNESAAETLAEGLEDTRTLHRLGRFPELGTRFKTTNLIERVMARGEAKTQRVDRGRSTDQKRGWCAATLLQIERQFRCVKGVKHLPLLQRALRSTLHSCNRCRVSGTPAAFT